MAFLPGGAAQNTARFAAHALGPTTTGPRVAFVGSVADDARAQTLRSACADAAVQPLYYVAPDSQTGVCACIISGHDRSVPLEVSPPNLLTPIRSLVTLLGAAEKFSADHLKSGPVQTALQSVQHIYIEGYFLTHSTPAILALLSDPALPSNITITLNLSAPFVAQFFHANLQQLLPYVDILLANEDEARAFAAAYTPAEHDHHTLPFFADKPTTTTTTPFKDATTQEIAQAISHIPKVRRPSEQRAVYFTQGPTSTVRAKGSELATFPVVPIPADEIVDTNAAGDAFAGGFLAALVMGRSEQDAVESGHVLAGKVCRVNGASLPK